MTKQTLIQLKDYSPKDFEAWKNSGLTKIFFNYLKDKNEDIRNMVMADFDGWAINAEKLPLVERRQTFSACLRDVMDVELNDMIEYYEGKADE